MFFKPAPQLLRDRSEGAHAKVTFVELFFDLVFVFTIIQLSHHLSHHFDIKTIVETFLLMLAIWIVWIYTTWSLNWLDPDTVHVRIMLYVVMLAGLILSTAIPDAFGDKGIFFGLAFAFIQVGRTLFITWATKERAPNNHRVFVLISIWLAISGLFWIIGGLVHPELRLTFWAIAVGIEFFSPMYGFWVPKLGKTGPRDWDISGAHMAERCGLFIIICLGESICVNGATFAKLDWDFANVAAFVISFALTVLMWWNYFHCGQYAGTKKIETSDNPGKVAMWAYHYSHIPIMVGVIMLAVACYMLFKHPLDMTDSNIATAFISSSLLFMIGCISFKRIVSGKIPISDIFGFIFVASSLLFYSKLNALTFAGFIMSVYFIMAVLEFKQAHKYHADTGLIP